MPRCPVSFFLTVSDVEAVSMQCSCCTHQCHTRCCSHWHFHPTRYQLWRHYTIRKKQAHSKVGLEEQLFLLDGVLQPALLKIRNLCLDVVEMQLCTINTEVTYTLDEFITAQHTHIDGVKQQLAVFREQVSSCQTFLCWHPFTSMFLAGVRRGSNSLLGGSGAKRGETTSCKP